MNEFDKTYGVAAFPVIVCDGDHKIIYKNPSAKRMIPFPRTGSKILGCFSSDDKLRLLYQKKRRLVKMDVPYYYSIAASLDRGSGSLLLFPLFAQFLGPGYKSFESDILDYAEQYISGLEKEENNEKQEKAVLSASYRPIGTAEQIRKQAGRIYELFCESGLAGMRCGISTAISDIVCAGKEIFDKYNFRVDYDISGILESKGVFVSFAAFSFIMTELTVLMLSISKKKKVLIESRDRNDHIETVIRCFSPAFPA